MRGVHFLGATLDVTANAGDAFFTVTMTAGSAGLLELSVPPQQPPVPLVPDVGVKVPAGATAVVALTNTKR